MVGNADDYFSLLGLSKQDDMGKNVPVGICLGAARRRVRMT